MTIGLDPMLEAVELPTGVSNLTAGLADMDRDTLTLERYDLREMCDDGSDLTMVGGEITRRM